MPASETPGGAAPPAADLDLIRQAAREAGALALSHFGTGPKVWYKNEGRSPVSAADMEVDRMLHDRLRAARPAYGWLSEETRDTAERLARETVFVVDPIDGTRAYLAGKQTWCVSIAVVHQGRPVAGVLFAPALDRLYEAHENGPARLNAKEIHVSTRCGGAQADGWALAAPDTLYALLPQAVRARAQRQKSVPSLAYRLAMVADGRLDGTLIRAKAHDWDLAAADLIVSRAGGRLLTPQGWEVDYNRPSTVHGVLAAGQPVLVGTLVTALADA